MARIANLIRILLVPSSDYLGHPFPQRHNQIFERLHDGKNFEVHVVEFRLFEKKNLRTKLHLHELRGLPKAGTASYYLTNMVTHARQIMKIIRDEGVDLVVLSNMATPFAYTLISQLSHRQVPTILDLPDYFPTSATGYICELSSISGKFLTTTFDLLLRYMIRRSSAVTAPSNALLHYAKSCGAGKAFYVPNGISEDFLKIHDRRMFREKLGFRQEDFVAGYIGSIDFWLDVGGLLAGIALAKKKGLRVKGVLAGRGLHNQVYSEKVTKWITRDGLQGDITRLDFVPHGDVPGYMAALDVGTIPFDVRNPTAYYSAPIKIWEYLSQKTPVISTPIPEALDNIDSLLVASQADDYARHLLAVHSGDEEISQKVNMGYCKAHSNTWQAAANRFASVCNMLLNETGHT